METGARLACTLQVMLAEEQVVAVLEATHTRRLRHTLLHLEGRNLAHIRDRQPAVRIASPTFHVKHPQQSVLILRPSARMRSKPGRT
jgi:hypothetical protein